jgi:hypothetical protein
MRKRLNNLRIENDELGLNEIVLGDLHLERLDEERFWLGYEDWMFNLFIEDGHLLAEITQRPPEKSSSPKKKIEL